MSNQTMNKSEELCKQTIKVQQIKTKLNSKIMAYISKSSLCHKFKAAMGISLIDYILREKIKTSFYMLSEGMNNRHIAEKLALSDEYYYSKLFKKVVGISPKEYKKTYFEA